MCDALRYVGKGGRGGVRVYSLPGPLAIGSELLHAGRAVCREFFIKVTLMRSPSPVRGLQDGHHTVYRLPLLRR